MIVATSDVNRIARRLLGALALLPALAFAQPAPRALGLAIEADAAAALRLAGVTVTESGARLKVTGRISRSLRQHVLPTTRLRLELRAADGSVKGTSTVHLSAVDLPRRSIRDARFVIEIDQVPTAGDALVLVLNPRRG